MKPFSHETEPRQTLFPPSEMPQTIIHKPTRLAKHMVRRRALYPEQATLLDKQLALQADTLAFPPQEVGAMGYIARLLAQFGLPHSDPGEGVLQYSRSNGELTFNVTSNVRDGGIAWGVMPRLLLAYVSTQAVLQKNRHITLGKNVSSFLEKELGMSVTGGKNGTVTRLKEQAYRLFTSSVTVVQKTEAIEGKTRGTRKIVGMVQLAESVNMWEPHDGKSTEEVWRSHVVLSDLFYEGIVNGAVPIDWRIVGGIQNSALALDLYFWLTYRLNDLRRKTTIPIFGPNSLYEQLGCGYADDKSGRQGFKRKLTAQLQQIQAFWPTLRLDLTDDGQCVVLYPGPPSVRRLG